AAPAPEGRQRGGPPGAALRPCPEQRGGRGGAARRPPPPPRRRRRAPPPHPRCPPRRAASRPLVRLLLFELRHAPARALERFDGLDRLVRVRRGAMRERAHFHRGCPLRRVARQPLLRRLRHLLAKLGPLPFERRALALERPESL